MAIVDQIQGFLEKAPLLKKMSIELPELFLNLEPDVLELYCEECGISRPHRDERPRGSGAGRPLPRLEPGVYRFTYACTGCRRGSYSFYVEMNPAQKWIRKIGQLPPWTIQIGRQLESHLGEAAGHYKRALICLSQSFGLGACAYLRRALEDSIDQLLRLESEVLELEGATSETMDEIRAAIAGKDFQTKTAVGYRLAPSSLVVEGENPLKLIHDRLSVGVHRLSEDECTEVAETLVIALQFTVAELNRRRESRQGFSESLRRVRARSPGSAPEA